VPKKEDDEGVEPTQPVEAVGPDEPADAPAIAETETEPRPPLMGADRKALGFFGVVLVVALVMMIVAGLLAGSDDDDSAEVAAVATTTTTVEEEETTTTSVAETTTTTAALTGGDPATSTTSTTIVCRDSTNRACGRFRFDPQPAGNQVMQVNATVEPANPQPGQVVTFTFVISDDAVPTQGSTDYGDGSVPTTVDRCSPRRTEGFGPWTPPARNVGNYTLTAQHVYAQAGTFRFQGTLNSSSWGTTTPPGDARGCPRDPYADTVTLEATITVS
jgi:hypothetical protein